MALERLRGFWCQYTRNQTVQVDMGIAKDARVQEKLLYR